MAYQRTTGLMGDPVPPGDATGSFFSDLGDQIKTVALWGIAGWIVAHLWQMTGSKSSRRGITVRL